MKKTILFYECKKALTAPIILALLLLFSAYNIFNIYSSSSFKEELHVANQLASKYGSHITSESLSTLEIDIKEELYVLNEMTEKKSGQTYESAFDFFSELSYEDEQRYADNELLFMHELYLKEMYAETAKAIKPSYEKINIEKIAESEIVRYKLEGQAAVTLRNQFAKFAERFADLQSNGEHTQWFFSGKQYYMHSLLFKDVFRGLVIELIILVVLATALVVNYEFENRTQLVTYSAKRGRRLLGDKLVASLIVTMTVMTILLFLTLGSYFIVYDYSHLFKSSISSAFNWEGNFPNVSWWSMSFMTYLLVGIALMYIALLLISMITFVIAVFVKNSYYTFLLFGGVFIILYLLQGFMPASSNLLYITGFNLSTLLLNPQTWFLGSKGLLLFKYYELITVSAWTIILVMLCTLCLRTFKNQSIV
ncbi:hypothetical protein LS684_04815 [Cytobacillus spongiae]|uniref:hypothetical protein n=1 Tax=Cytobacillus spongiae TaxID=2901381 RepID=UPI001F3DC4EB|nr:hypothetical protein [Cytobacillus spongiae]UII56792.1 hypothetical protein LS684_04815 [Cytobacillus spongiae]